MAASPKKAKDITPKGQPEPYVVSELPRLIFLKPEIALQQAKLKPGSVVADLGSGAGYLSIPAAIQVGAQGHVYAVDIIKDNLASIRSQAKLYNLPNIETIWADLEMPGSTGIPDERVDISLLFKVLCQQRNHEVILGEAKRVTRSGGTILIAEWCEPQLSEPTIGPAKESLVTRQELLSLGKKVGLQLEQEHKLDDFHYVLEYKRP